MNLKQLTDTYFDRIQIEDTDFLDSEGVSLAVLSLSIPKNMLQDYLKIKNQNRELPEINEFWKETGLAERLEDSNKYHGQGHEPLQHILGFLKGEVSGEYNRLNSEQVSLDIIEEPRSNNYL